MNKAKRFHYVVGDVQGCFGALQKLLETINFDTEKDFIWFAGDLVARGENSLKTLRFIKSMVEKKCAATVLGNHDLTLIACARGIKKAKTKDKIHDILEAKDCDELIDWLRHQPLYLALNDTAIMTHAGIPHIWNIQQVENYAIEVEKVLRDKNWKNVDTFLKEMYSNEPDIWSDHLTGQTRLRIIVNYLTRMRLIDIEGRLDFHFKEGLNDPMPQGFAPWFSIKGKIEKTHQIFFGHWAALEGETHHKMIHNVDGGCVWGGHMIAYRLEDQHVFRVKNLIE
ncbi:symmetrical bis(5'-nucleosyl)-tetraphosphatase [Acinetobacter pollinis]|uniref:symmetrical bis(5'-nucleosyl)-tetraphosphatase n=1 Tax=Acinetobacter pollinis TaxID=2605270 RepID=UPI0018A2E7CC|nr:symmetrical bis(5'-nucleosyl)-tetraphosphatase [Acinetobacter pollinis]MBF7691236.1 symmetrical bis(5'-nucleosyl)-tetraphosphatase [Acinetobacter pollinis]MBF7693834.1 symmetrical bis(5'-nucleosyl)-tetraphosphatase [Acinetobacter pollinis]MBF7698932.1 symmetrical bis(5'-nucleosyl)-tetraphosphatase [Acinetobacter pollinis]MBF7701384.1 symmetrical bis(5'-nucleosyl)-tetraphosphatase [Acinetobacter pollinis]